MDSCDIIQLLNGITIIKMWPYTLNTDVFIFYLDGLMTNSVRAILSQLDEKSLGRAELVSTVWRKIVSEECIWKCVLRNKVTNVLVHYSFTLIY